MLIFLTFRGSYLSSSLEFVNPLYIMGNCDSQCAYLKEIDWESFDKSRVLDIEIEHSTAPGYSTYASMIQTKVVKYYPLSTFKVIPRDDSSECLEVRADGILVHSKLAGDGFVTGEAMVRMFQRLQESDSSKS